MVGPTGVRLLRVRPWQRRPGRREDWGGIRDPRELWGWRTAHSRPGLVLGLGALCFGAPPGPGPAEAGRECALGVGEKALQAPEPQLPFAPPDPHVPGPNYPSGSSRPKGCIACSHSGWRNHRWAAGGGTGVLGGVPPPRTRTPGCRGRDQERQSGSFVRGAPGSHAPSARSSSWKLGVGPRPQLMAERAARDWLRPGPPPFDPRGLGCGHGRLSASHPRGSRTPWVQLCMLSGHSLHSSAGDWQLRRLAACARGSRYRTVADLWTALGGRGESRTGDLLTAPGGGRGGALLTGPASWGAH